MAHPVETAKSKEADAIVVGEEQGREVIQWENGRGGTKGGEGPGKVPAALVCRYPPNAICLPYHCHYTFWIYTY